MILPSLQKTNSLQRALGFRHSRIGMRNKSKQSHSFVSVFLATHQKLSHSYPFFCCISLKSQVSSQHLHEKATRTIIKAQNCKHT